MKRFIGIGVVAWGLAYAGSAMAADGAAIFEAKCWSCHGTFSAWITDAPAFKDNAFIKNSKVEDIMAVVREGRAGAEKKYKQFEIDMPPYKGVISEDDIKAVVEYVKTTEDPEYAEARLKQEEEQAKKEELERKLLAERGKAKLHALIKTQIGERLPQSYKGHDIQKIYQKFSKTLSGKKEFEKEDDYKKRLQAINLEEVYVFRVDQKALTHVKYDADKEAFDIGISYNSAIILQPSDIKTIDNFIALKTSNEKRSFYKGTNAFGAEAIITKHEANKLGVNLINEGEDSIYRATNISVAMSIKDAKKYKDTINVILICKPVIKDGILAFSGFYHSKPTFTDPVEIYDSVSGINVVLHELWVYDFKTGNIFFKQDFDD